MLSRNKVSVYECRKNVQHFSFITQNLMQVVSAHMHLSGELQFINNSGGEESALHLLSFAHVILEKGLNIIFAGNSGRY